MTAPIINVSGAGSFYGGLFFSTGLASPIGMLLGTSSQASLPSLYSPATTSPYLSQVPAISTMNGLLGGISKASQTLSTSLGSHSNGTIAGALNAFANSYNSAIHYQTSVGSALPFDFSGTMTTSLKDQTSDLAGIGISFASDGTMKVDTNAFNTAYAQDGKSTSDTLTALQTSIGNAVQDGASAAKSAFDSVQAGANANFNPFFLSGIGLYSSGGQSISTLFGLLPSTVNTYA